MKIFQSSWLKHVKMEGEDLSKKSDENNDTINHLKKFLANTPKLEHSENNRDIESTQENTDSMNNEKNSDSFGIDQLQLVVKEYENLKENYETLQAEVEAKIKDNEKYEKEIQTLQQENKKLNDHIETLYANSENFANTKDELTAAFQKTIDKLELELKEQKKLTNEANERLTAHDTAAKRAISVLQKEMGAKVEQVTKLYQDSLSEKDSQIIKIAKLESTIDEINATKQNQNKKLTEHQTELESLRALLKSKSSDLSKIATSNESHEKEVSKLNKKIETLQEDVKNQEMKVKWAQNKLKTELDSHKETKKQVTQLNGKLQQAKEEGDMIRKDCQQMIERYQGDEEIQSVRLNKELEEHIAKLKTQEEDLTKQEEINKERLQAIEIVNKENQKLSQELSEQKDLVLTLGEKNKELAHQLGEQEKDCADVKTSLEQMKDQVKEFDENLAKIKEYEAEIQTLKETELKLNQSLREAELEVKEQAEKHQEILQFSANLTENNVSTKAAAADLQNQLDALLAEKENLLEKLNTANGENDKKVQLLEEEKNKLEKELTETKTNCEENSNKVKELTLSLEDSQEELRVLKRKNAAQVKDLQRQLHQTTRKIEKMESSSLGSTENLSIRSRTSSCNSIEKIHHSESPPNSSSPQLHHEPVMINQDHYINQPNRLQQHQQAQLTNSFPEVEIDQKVLIERICKLQRTLAKKREKMEFMEEHISQLTEDIQKKSKILQFYALKEEAGSIAPDRYDRVKAEACQHGGIMASVYSARPTDKNMTLDLSLTINRKLQAVLEDTILKNITLKESINTLGDEIAKLQVELDQAKKT